MAGTMQWIYLIVLFFVASAVFLPFVYAEFQPDTSTTFNSDDLATKDGVSTLDVLLSVFTIFFWQFGSFPVWLNIVFIPFRIILGVSLYNVLIHGAG